MLKNSILSLVLQAGPLYNGDMTSLRLFSPGLSSFKKRVCYHGQALDSLRIHSRAGIWFVNR